MSTHIVVMGVSGKSTVGAAFAEAAGLPYKDGDDLHPQANIDKMASGTPLDDEDRWPWLELVGKWLEEHPAGGVIGCSVLKRVYHDTIRRHCPDAVFVHVDAPVEVLAERMNHRPGHFMPASLLQSQLDTLEQLQPDEVGFKVSVVPPVADVVKEIQSQLG